MTLHVTSQQVWDEIEKHNFAVLGMATTRCEPRTVGIVYVVDEHKLYIGAARSAWKIKHIERNPHVSATVAIPKRVPLMPWIKVPAATITFSGTARVLAKQDLGEALLDKLYRHDDGPGEWCAIEVTPENDFITYGVGVSLLTMRSPARSRSRSPVRAAEPARAAGTVDAGSRGESNRSSALRAAVRRGFARRITQERSRTERRRMTVVDTNAPH